MDYGFRRNDEGGLVARSSPRYRHPWPLAHDRPSVLSWLDWTTGRAALPARLRTALSSERPLYRQLTDHLRREIAGEAPGTRITSEPRLARAFRISRFTVSRAIEA